MCIRDRKDPLLVVVILRRQAQIFAAQAEQGLAGVVGRHGQADPAHPGGLYPLTPRPVDDLGQIAVAHLAVGDLLDICLLYTSRCV